MGKEALLEQDDIERIGMKNNINIYDTQEIRGN